MSSLVCTPGAPGSWEFNHLSFEPFGGEVANAIHATFASTGEGEDVVADELSKLRNALGNLVHGAASSDDKTQVVGAIDEFTAEYSQFAPDAIKSFLGKEAVSQMYQADDWALRKVVRWWNDEHVKFQAGLNEAKPDLRREATDAAARLADSGLITLYGFKRIQDSMQVHNVKPMDPFMQGAHSAKGLYLLATREIGLANNFINQKEYAGVSAELAQTYFHEILHGAGVLSRSGYWQAPRGNSILIEEATVAHNSNVAFADTPLPDVLHPAKRTNDDGMYAPERGLLALAGIDAVRLCRGYFERDESQNRHHVYAALTSLVARALRGQESLSALLSTYEHASGYGKGILASTWLGVATDALQGDTPKDFAKTV